MGGHRQGTADGDDVEDGNEHRAGPITDFTQFYELVQNIAAGPLM